MIISLGGVSTFIMMEEWLVLWAQNLSFDWSFLALVFATEVWVFEFVLEDAFADLLFILNNMLNIIRPGRIHLHRIIITPTTSIIQRCPIRFLF